MKTINLAKTTPLFIVLLLVAFSGSHAKAHSGRTNAEGCHNQTSNNSYHCHQKGKSKKKTKYKNSTKKKSSSKYNRKSWVHWADYDGDCQNERHELLIKKSLVEVTLNKSGCTVKTGKWITAYIGEIETQARLLDIDHVIPLAWMHYNGGHTWTKKKKKEFANDRLNLRVSNRRINQNIKGAKGINDWLPEKQYKKARCHYVDTWQKLSIKYNISFPKKIIAFIKTEIDKCIDLK